MRLLEAIADPIRLSVIHHLAVNERGTAAQLAEAAGVHENTIRPHLAALEAGGVLVSEKRPVSGPGRPGVDYLLAQDVAFGNDFLGLAELLVAALGRMDPEPGELRAVGTDWGRYLVGRPGKHDVDEQVPNAMDRLGWEARVDADCVRLFGCPCPLVSADNPRLVCSLGVGVIDGTLAASGSELEVASSEHDPEQRRCAVTLGESRSPERGAR